MHPTVLILILSLLVAGVPAPAAESWLLEAPEAYWRARYQHETRYRYDLALPSWQAALAASEHPRLRAECLAGIAETAHLLGEQAVAEGACRELVAEYPEDPATEWVRAWNRRRLAPPGAFDDPYRFEFLWHDGRQAMPVAEGELKRLILRDGGFGPEDAPGGLVFAPDAPRAHASTDTPFERELDPGPGHWTLWRLQVVVGVRKASPRAPWSGSEHAEAWPDDDHGLRAAVSEAEHTVGLRIELSGEDGPVASWPVELPVGQRRAWRIEVHPQLVFSGPLRCRVVVDRLPVGSDVGVGQIARVGNWRHVLRRDGLLVPARVTVRDSEGRERVHSLPRIQDDDEPPGVHFFGDDRAWHIALPVLLPEAPAIAADCLRVARGRELKRTPVVPRPLTRPPDPVVLDALPDVFHGVDGTMRGFGERLQRADGSWGWEDGGTVEETALMLLVYLGAGYDHRTPSRHRQTVERGLAWLRAQQGEDGAFAAATWEQALASMALAEAWAMTRDPELEVPAQRAADEIVRRQRRGPEGLSRGWSTADSEAIDSVTTLFAVMSLKSGKAGGLEIGDAFALGASWLEAAWLAANDGVPGPRFPMRIRSREDGSMVADGDRPEIGLVAAGFLGWRQGELMPRLAETVAVAVAVRPGLPVDRVYMGTLGSFVAGGAAWDRWRGVIRSDLLARQITDGGRLDGGWSAEGAFDWYPGRRNPLTATALASLALEVFYRFLPVAPSDHELLDRWSPATPDSEDEE